MRKMFYKDKKGNMFRYHYCMECDKQYDDAEFKSGLIVNVGSDKLPIEYCAKTCLDKKLSIHTFKGTRHLNETLETKFVKLLKRGACNAAASVQKKVRAKTCYDAIRGAGPY